MLNEVHFGMLKLPRIKNVNDKATLPKIIMKQLFCSIILVQLLIIFECLYL